MTSIFGPYGPDPEQDSGLLQPQDTLDDAGGVTDVLDTGWSPPERPWGVEDWGITEAEESAGESLDGRLARELPDAVEDEGAGTSPPSPVTPRRRPRCCLRPARCWAGRPRPSWRS